MGTTVTAALLLGGQLNLAHVGDSRGFLMRGSEIQQITVDHSLVAELVRNGGLTEAEASMHPQRNVLTRALGTEPLVAVDIWQGALEDGDALILCSDGVTRHLGVEDLKRTVMGNASPEEAAAALVDLANRRGGTDNLTVVVALWGTGGWTRSTRRTGGIRLGRTTMR
jgi:protein phosphatase